MVDDYRSARAAAVRIYYESQWRDESVWATLINFKRWLQTYRYEQPPV